MIREETRTLDNANEVEVPEIALVESDGYDCLLFAIISTLVEAARHLLTFGSPPPHVIGTLSPGLTTAGVPVNATFWAAAATTQAAPTRRDLIKCIADSDDF